MSDKSNNDDERAFPQHRIDLLRKELSGDLDHLSKYQLAGIELQMLDELERLNSLGTISLRQHAAIELRVPDSGIDWIDAMIRESNREAMRADLAGQALPALIAEMMSRKDQAEFAGSFDGAAVVEAGKLSFLAADVMLEASDA